MGVTFLDDVVSCKKKLVGTTCSKVNFKLSIKLSQTKYPHNQY